MPKMMPPDFSPEGSPVSEEIVFRAVQEYLPDDWHVLHSFHFTSDDPQGKKKDGEIDFLFYNPTEATNKQGRPCASRQTPTGGLRDGQTCCPGFASAELPGLRDCRVARGPRRHVRPVFSTNCRKLSFPRFPAFFDLHFSRNRSIFIE